MTNLIADEWAERLLMLGLVVQRHVHQQVSSAASFENLAASTGEVAGDRIYAIDRVVEELVLDEIRQWPSMCFPLHLIAEGIGEDGHIYFESAERVGLLPVVTAQPASFRVIMDPIDGTRMLMYDKRSAWFLGAVAIDRGDETSLADTFASVMVELPPSKQTLADCFTATRGGGAKGIRVDVRSNQCSNSSEATTREELSTGTNRLSTATAIPVRPSTSPHLRDGFVSVVSFFPGIKVLAAELTEQIALLETQTGIAPNIFDDQYISSGGQLVQLMTGRDRCVLDLRPLFARSPRCSGKVMTAHPYDLAGLLVAQEAGVIVTDGFGQPLNAPLDVTSEVHWCGYANEAIRSLIEPIVQTAVRQ